MIIKKNAVVVVVVDNKHRGPFRLGVGCGGGGGGGGQHTQGPFGELAMEVVVVVVDNKHRGPLRGWL